MILVLTTQAGDYSHIRIIDWLNYLKANYLTITGESLLLGQEKLALKNGQVFYNDTNLFKDVTCVFYRRWITGSQVQITDDTRLNKSLNRNMVSEMYEIRNFLYKNLKNVIWVPDADSVNVNKLYNLEQAKRFGLNVPNYIITNSKEELIRFYNENDGKIITKAIGNFQKGYTEDGLLVNPIYTKIVDSSIIDFLPERFILSFFQKFIQKQYEYRILYFNKRCYSTMILSQENDLTKVDSRLNNDTIEARLVPIDISVELENKIIQFMCSLNLNIGCLDFLHSLDNQYYFLEVNPVGQFGGYSERCLLDFEKDIVKELVRIDNEHKN